MSASALVLGGGGVTGIAWEIGVLHGLAAAGVDLSGADVVLGTSAGSVVGTLLASGRPLADVYDDQLAPPDAQIGGRFGRGTILRMLPPMLLPGSGRARRRRLGRAALRAHPEPADVRIEVIRARLGAATWPDRDLRITAVDATSGASVVFDRSSGVDLVEAVAASCAVPMVWPPVPVNGVPHMDGGMRSTTNADLVRGARRRARAAAAIDEPRPFHSGPARAARPRRTVGSRHAGQGVAGRDRSQHARPGTTRRRGPGGTSPGGRSGRRGAGGMGDRLKLPQTDENFSRSAAVSLQL